MFQIKKILIYLKEKYRTEFPELKISKTITLKESLFYYNIFNRFLNILLTLYILVFQLCDKFLFVKSFSTLSLIFDGLVFPILITKFWIRLKLSLKFKKVYKIPKKANKFLFLLFLDLFLTIFIFLLILFFYTTC